MQLVAGIGATGKQQTVEILQRTQRLPIPGAMIMSSLILVNMVHTICFQQGPMVKWEPRTTSPTGV